MRFPKVLRILCLLLVAVVLVAIVHQSARAAYEAKIVEIYTGLLRTSYDKFTEFKKGGAEAYYAEGVANYTAAVRILFVMGEEMKIFSEKNTLLGVYSLMLWEPSKVKENIPALLEALEDVLRYPTTPPAYGKLLDFYNRLD